MKSDTYQQYEGPVLDVRGLKKSYGSFTAVSKLSMKVEKGEFMGLLGPNGSGKSTTLKCITGLTRPTEGEVYINGVDIRHHTESLKHVGCVIETPECYPHFTPAEMMGYVGRMHGMPDADIKMRAREVLDEMRIWEWRNGRVGSFSKGMKQRVALAAALLPDPDLIILDEPTSGLDPRGMIETRQILNDLKKKDLTLVISTHILKEVSEMCTAVTMISHGKRIVSGKVEDLLSKLSEGLVGTSIEIRSINSMTQGFFSDLGAMPGVMEVVPMGDKTAKFTFNGTVEQQADILDLMHSSGLRPISFRDSSADLEDLYMKLTSDEKEVSIL
jgi:ABC-2 type transport system ATP-binding protein